MADTTNTETPTPTPIAAPPPQSGGIFGRPPPFSMGRVAQQAQPAPQQQANLPPPAQQPQIPQTPQTPQLPQFNVPSQDTVRSAYIPPQVREPGQLGKPWWPNEAAKNYPGRQPPDRFLPPPAEGYKLMGQTSGQMAKTSPPAVAGPLSQVSNFIAGFQPLLDWVTRGGFSEGFTRANALQLQKQLGALQVQREQMLLANDQAYQAHQGIMLEYDDILSRANLPDGDPHKLSPQEAEAELSAAAARHQDYGLQNQIANGGLPLGIRHLQQEDRNMRMLQAGATSVRNATKGEKTDAEEMAELGHSTDVSGQGLGASTAFNYPNLQGGQQKAVGQDDSSQTQFDAASKTIGATEQEKEVASQIYNGEDDITRFNKDGAARHRLEQLIAAKRADINAVAHGAGTPDEKMRQIEEMDPEAASRLDGLLKLRTNPKDIPMTHGQRSIMEAQAQAINPHWKSSSYDLAKQYEQTNQTEVKAINRVSSLTTAANRLNADLLPISQTQHPIEADWKKVYAEKWTGDPTYPRIYADIQNVLNEVAAVQAGTGRPAVTNVKMRAQEMLNTMSPAQIQAQLQSDIEAAYGSVRSIEAQYKQTVGDPNAELPFYSKETKKEFRAILRSNPNTGEMPEDASGAMRATSRPQTEKKPSWLITDPNNPNYNAWKPMTEAQVVEGRRQVAQLEKSTSATDHAKAQYIRKRLGIFADPEPGDPDYGEYDQSGQPGQQSVSR